MLVPFLQKYQPRRMEDFYFDDYFHSAINSLMEIDFLNILFIGDCGTGKTSIINALITQYYGKPNCSSNPQNNCDIQKNVLYITNLKDQGITYYRNDVKTFCQIQCTIPNKKKIVVVDDLDMINQQSQQVFRHCIDTYGSNIHFISSCSNTQKIINSIQSRTTIIRLRHLTNTSLMKIITNISQKENINITESAKQQIIRISDHSTSTIINYLEKCKLLQSDITVDIINRISTTISFYILKTYTDLCADKKYKEAIYLLYELFDKGYSVLDILDSYFCYIKQESFLTESQKYKIIIFISDYITIFHNEHENEIELALFTKNIIEIF
tara:strand:- start:357 stop:1334 length:978 start_codon:yes stop_codon:yes gene_type:complete